MITQLGLGVPSLCLIGALLLSAVVAAWYSCRTQNRQPATTPDPAIKTAVDEHWETTPDGRRVWRGATFTRPGKKNGGRK